MSQQPRSANRLVWFFLIASAVLTCSLGLLGIYLAWLNPDTGVVVRHYSSVVGLPFAATASLFIVLICDVGGREKLKFQGLGFKFEGASSQVILWVICFLAIAIAIKMLWSETYSMF
jgi:hypothetical protein